MASNEQAKPVTKITLTDQIRRSMCEHKKEHPSISQKDMQEWVKENFDLVTSQTTISNTLKRSSEYLSDEMKYSNVKRHKSAKYPELEKALYEWFLQRQEKVNMSGEMIQGKAKEFMQKMYGETNSEFSFSSGWLERFKARYSIKSYRRFGESGSVNKEDIANALPEIRSKLDQFNLKDIYNMDEIRLFYRLEADHSLATKQLEGRKKDKERITTAVCCNGDGSDKVPLWVIGKYAKPKCFKNVNMNNLNCEYQFNKKAWMTGLLFQEYCHWFDKRMNGRKMLEADSPNLENINILDAINFATMAWSFDVRTKTIANCFRHCKIRSEEVDVPEVEDGQLEQEIQDLTKLLSKLNYRNVINVEHLLNYHEENNVVMDSPTDEEIIEAVLNDEANDPEPDDSITIPQVLAEATIKEAKSCSNTRRNLGVTFGTVCGKLRELRAEITRA
ncbi:CENP-B homolog protein 2-like [Apium graveolens]|uniref:CENP-B homolog protein 2-like n=1 Tax=Apium graveolens TaxID=4045 RepID=UPI003D78EC94